MDVTYDPDADAAYVYIGPTVAVSEEEVVDDVFVDLDAQGRVVGVEVQNAAGKGVAVKQDQGRITGVAVLSASGENVVIVLDVQGRIAGVEVLSASGGPAPGDGSTATLH